VGAVLAGSDPFGTSWAHPGAILGASWGHLKLSADHQNEGSREALCVNLVLGRYLGGPRASWEGQRRLGGLFWPAWEAKEQG
jgi:hypothetical protein